MKDAKAVEKFEAKVNNLADRIEQSGNTELANELRALVNEVHANGSSWY